MTKAASVSIGLVFLFATATVSWSQSSPAEDAVREAVRRQAAVQTLRQTLVEARDAELRRDLQTAAKRYEECYKLTQSIGSGYGIEMEQAQTIGGLTAVRMELAQAAYRRGDWREADLQVSRALLVDPKNPAAIAFKQTNDKALAENQSHLPSPAVVEQVAVVKQEKAGAYTLVQDARILLEAGELDQADAKLKEALKLDPSNEAAFYYSSLVKEARFRLAEGRREQDSKKGIIDVQKAWERPTSRDALPVPNPYARNNQIHTSKGRQAIASKLDRIRMDNVLWDGLGLSEVVKILSDEAKKRDPEKRGINFIINPNVEAATVAPLQQFTDPTTGLPLSVAPPEPVDINTVSIKINPEMTDVRLADVLEAIVKVADKPIKYSLEDYAVVFSLRGAEPQMLFLRTYKVDPNTFYQGLENVNAFAFGDIQTSTGGGGTGGGGGSSSGGTGGTGGGNITTIPRVNVAGGGGLTGGGGGAGGISGGGGGTGGGLRFITQTNSMEAVSMAVVNFFTTLGVNLDPLLGKSVFWNDRTGLLMVRATEQELDTIETAIQILNVTPHQVNIKAKFVEITQTDNRALGFDWFLGNVLMGGGDIGYQGGTAPSFGGAPSAGNPGGTFPGNVLAGTAIAPATSDGLLTSGLRNNYGLNSGSIPAVATVTGILTEPQFRVVIRALDQREGADLLSSPEVTTVSGRQAQIQVVDMRTIVTGVDQQQGNQGAAAATPPAGGGVVQQAAAATFVTPTTQILPFGPVLDVVPYISADGYTIQMTIIPTYTEFVGYDLETAAAFVPQAITGTGQTITSLLPLPILRVRQVTTSAVVWDGQTIVLGGLLSENVQRFKDKVPILGDIPYLGRFFRSESSTTAKKNLMIFVTPTIIDPAGNRLNSEDELPFNPNTIPPQTMGMAR